MTGTMRGAWDYMSLAATAQRMDVLGVDEWTFTGDLLSHYQTYYDSLDMSRQLGVLPAVGSAADRTIARLQHLQARFLRRKAGGPEKLTRRLETAFAALAYGEAALPCRLFVSVGGAGLEPATSCL